MIRRARMQGRPTLWLPGVDHASIAAQFVLDGIIAREGETRASLGRERYLERMWQFIEETRDIIVGQQQRLGASADWRRERFTMDAASARAVRTAWVASRPREPVRGPVSRPTSARATDATRRITRPPSLLNFTAFDSRL